MLVSRACRSSSYRMFSSLAASKSRQGLPSAVVTVGDQASSGALKPNEIRVKMIFAPVALLDILRIQGLVPSANTKCGSEGVGVVEEVGSGVSGLKKGDHVIPGKAELGTWAQSYVATEKDVFSVPKDIQVEQAALLGSSAATALRVLSDVGSLNKGDCVIVNGADSSLGEAVIQIAKAKGLKAIGVTGAKNLKDVESKLKGMGASTIVAEAFAGSSAFRKVCVAENPKLAIHCSNSESAATDLARTLAPGGTLVAVLGAGKVTVPASVLINRGIKITGFSLEKSLQDGKVKETVDELISLAKSGALKQTVSSTSSLHEIQGAIESVSGRSSGNILLKF